MFKLLPVRVPAVVIFSLFSLSSVCSMSFIFPLNTYILMYTSLFILRLRCFPLWSLSCLLSLTLLGLYSFNSPRLLRYSYKGFKFCYSLNKRNSSKFIRLIWCCLKSLTHFQNRVIKIFYNFLYSIRIALIISYTLWMNFLYPIIKIVFTVICIRQSHSRSLAEGKLKRKHKGLRIAPLL